MNKTQAKRFHIDLLKWHQHLERPMPWKGIKNPYFIWLSEIILQQTRVEQGWKYYEKFIAKYPTVEQLAKASEDSILKDWQGLGYYSRARNLHKAAKQIVEQHGGQFPNSYQTILALPGIGPYTAAAISSFAYNLAHAAVDGNVLRIISRVFKKDEPINKSQHKGLYQSLADRLLSQERPGAHNQAMMDLGATICLPKNPVCTDCPVQNHCKSHDEGTVELRPTKHKPAPKKERNFHYFIFRVAEKTLLHKRTEKDIWHHLYQFPLFESKRPKALSKKEVNALTEGFVGRTKIASIKTSKAYRQILSHQKINAHFYTVELMSLGECDKSLIEIKLKNISKHAFPKIIDWYLNDNSITLVDSHKSK